MVVFCEHGYEHLGSKAVYLST